MSIQAGGISEQSGFLDQILDDGAIAGSGSNNGADGVTLPDAEFLLRGDYSRDGDDLRITKDSGDSYVVEGYFADAAPPALYAPNGAGLLFDTVAKLVGAQVAGYAEPQMVAGPVPGAEPIGTVRSLRGAATAKSADGQVRELAKGDPIYLNDAVETADGSFLRLTFEDGTAFFLGRNARAVIDEYVYKPAEEEGSFGASVAIGFFRYISGKLGKLGDGDKPHSSIKTPTATIGIRGSDVEGEVDEAGITTLIHHSGVIDVADINGIGMVTLLVPGSATVVSPEGVRDIFQAPPEMTQRFQENLPPPSNGDAPYGEDPGAPGQPGAEPGAEGDPAAAPADDAGEGGEGAEAGDGGEADAGEDGADDDAEDDPDDDVDDGRDDVGDDDGDPDDDPGERDGAPDDRDGPGDEFDEPGDGPGDGFDADGPRAGGEPEGDPDDGPGEGPGEGARFAGEGPEEFDGPDDGPGEGPEAPEFEPVFRDGFDLFAGLEAGLEGGGDEGLGDDPGEPFVEYGELAGMDGEFALDAFGNPLEPGMEPGEEFDDKPLEPDAGDDPDPIQDLPPVIIDAEDDFFFVDFGTVFYGNMVANDRNFAPDQVRPFIAGYTEPAHGDLRVGADGTFAYTPDPGYHGFDSFHYVIGDGLGGRYPATVFIEVGGAVVGPAAVDDYYLATAGQPLTDNVLANDWANLPATATPRVVDHSEPAHGTLSLNPDGSFTYTPDAGFSGIDGFSYLLDDGFGGVHSAIVEIEVGGGAVAPVDIDDRYYTDMDVTLRDNVMANDWAALPPGASPSVFSGVLPDNGTLTLNEDGSFTYQPDAGFMGYDFFTYVLEDGFGGRYEGYVEINVGGAAGPTGGMDDYYSIDADGVLSADLLANDRASLPAGATPRLVDHTLPENGTLTVTPDGQFTYTPPPGFVGITSFTYTVGDGFGGVYTAFVGIDVGGFYVPGGRLDDDYATAMDTPFFANVLENDWMELPAGASATISSHTDPANGTLTLTADGEMSYTPDAGFFGFDFFSYTLSDGLGGQYTAVVSFDVGAEAPPVIGDLDDYFYTDMEQPLSGSVLVNDWAALPAGANPTVVGHGQPANGSLTLGADGNFTYTPTAGYSGIDHFTYLLDDGLGGSHTVYVEVEVGGGHGPGDGPESGIDDYFRIAADDVLSGDLLANDRMVAPAGAVLTITGHVPPANGTLTILSDGTFSYTPIAGFVGIETFTYQVDDGVGGSYEGFVGIDVGGLYDPGGNLDDHFYIEMDASFSGDVLANDYAAAPAGVTLTIVSHTQPANGSVTLSPDGGFTYTPDPGYAGFDLFSYVVSDGTTSKTAVVTFDVGTSAPPTDGGMEDYFYVAPDGSITDSVLANDWSSLPANATPTVSLASDVANGTLALASDGTFTYTPTAGYLGPDDFSYTLDDGLGGSYQVWVHLDVGGGATGPMDDFFYVAPDASITDNVLSNDWGSLPAGATPAVVTTTGVSHGTLDMAPDGTFTYTPTAGYLGPDDFSYTLDDGLGGSYEVWVYLDVGGGGADAKDDDYFIEPDLPFSANVLDNDLASLPAGATPTVVGNTAPLNGTLTISANGDFTYTPYAGFTGHDTFIYTADDGLGSTYDVYVDIDVGGGAPASDADDYYAIAMDTPLSENVLVNDWGSMLPAGATPTVTAYDQPANGSVTISPNGDMTYTPIAAYTGHDFFSYTVDDGLGGSYTAYVDIDVGVGGGTPSGAADDHFYINIDTPIVENVIANDWAGLPAGATPTVVNYSMPANGSLTLDTASGSFTYTPFAGFAGMDGFTYTIDDGFGGISTAQVALDVGGGGGGSGADDYFSTPMDVALSGHLFDNDWAIAPAGATLTLVSHTQPANGSITVANDGSFTYTPTAAFIGTDTFSYMVDDGLGAQHTAHVTIDVGGGGGANAIPVTGYDFYTIPMDSQAFGNVLDNDHDPDGDPLSVQLQDPPSHGTVNLTASGAFTYTPSAGFVGNDFFSYVADDGRGGYQVEWVEVEVGGGGGGGANSAPFTVYDTYSTAMDAPVSGNVLANDLDPDGDPLSAWVDTHPTNGTLTLTADGSFTYTPFAAFIGMDSFAYAADDGRGGVTHQWVDIEVGGGGGGGNTAPVAGDDYFTTLQDQPVGGSLTANDYDPDGDPISAALYIGPANGSASVNPDGTFNYTPMAGFVGSDSFQYEVTDGRGGAVIATVHLTIDPAGGGGNSPPSAVGDYFSGPFDTIINGNVLFNDSDPDGDPLSVISYSQPANGTVTVSATGDMTYQPTAAYIGPDSFDYTIDDGFGHTMTATVNIDIT